MRVAHFVLAILLAAPAPASATDIFGSFDPGTDRKLPNDGRPAHRVPFPAIGDWRSLKITLTRTMCFGTCPVYTVEIDGDGSVVYNGGNFVVERGERRAKIAPEQVRALYEAFRKAEFFWLLDGYHSGVTDMPTQTLTIAFDGRSKQVVDYAGAMIGMPRGVGELERLVDTTANTARWIGVDSDPRRRKP
jgi:hypothetical protein